MEESPESYNRQTHLAGTKDEVVATQNEITLLLAGTDRLVRQRDRNQGRVLQEEESGQVRENSGS